MAGVKAYRILLGHTGSTGDQHRLKLGFWMQSSPYWSVDAVGSTRPSHRTDHRAEVPHDAFFDEIRGCMGQAHELAEVA